MRFLIILLFSVFCFANELNIIDLSKYKWEYRWGDSPFEKNVPIWSMEKNTDSKWSEIGFPSNPPNRDGKSNVWYRVKLPDKLTNDPNLYIFSVDILTEVYYKGKQIYHFGKFNEKAQGEFAGWPWHMFSLPKDSAGQYLYFRVYSNYIDIGLWGEVLVASKGDILKKLLNDDIPKIMVGSIAIFVSVIFLLSFLLKLKRIELFILGLLFLTQGLDVLCTVKIIQIYLFYPLLNQYLLAISFFFFPVGMAMYLDKTIEYKGSYNPVRVLWQVHLLYLLGAVGGALIGFYDIASTYKYFDILYNFISLPVLTIFIAYFFYKGDFQTKLITFSFLIISFYWFYSSMVAYGILQWVEYPNDIAVFLCLLLLSYSIVKNLNYTQELESEKEQLSILSSIDYLTKLYNRKEIDLLLDKSESFFQRYKEHFSIILLDIDNFKEVNDTYGHLVGDRFLIELADILKNNVRETDFIGRWGGEEFLIICPKTNDVEVLRVAEHLRKKIDSHTFDTIGKKTASFGVSTYKDDDCIINLISRADEAMYESKSGGKNKVSFI